MNMYCLCRAWRFHGILEKKFKPSPDNFEKSGHLLAKFQIDNQNSEMSDNGFFEIRNKIYSTSQIQKRGHDIFPAIDILPETRLLEQINTLLIEQIINLRKLNVKELDENSFSFLKLIHFQLRITDYGFLLIYITFENNDLEKIISYKSDLIRAITSLILSFDQLFDFLLQEKLIFYSSHRFGIPLSFLGLLQMDETDTYQYQEHIFCTIDDDNFIINCLELINEEKLSQKPSPNLTTDKFAVYNINSAPVWHFYEPFLVEDIPYYLQPEVRALAELTNIDSATLLFTEISKFLLKTQNLPYLKRLWLKKSKKGYSETLRKISLNYALTLQQLRSIRNDFEPWQILYEKLVRKSEPGIAEAEKLYSNAENNLSNLIQSIESEENSRHQKRIEVIFLLFAGIALGSAYVDIISFIEVNQSNFTQLNFHFLETKLLILLVLLVILLLLYVAKKRRY